MEATFLFADIAGYTALTEAHGDEEAADLAAAFAEAVRGNLPDGAELVKTIGDAVMVRVPDAADAVRLGLCLTRNVLGEHGAPSIRVGMNHGGATERGGDYFGATVNLAARVAAAAGAGEVLVTGHTAALAPDLEGVLWESRGRQPLRNVREPVELFAAVPVGAPGAPLPVDPVCGMLVDPERAVGRLVFEGTTFYFCTLACAGEFARDPARFV